MNEPDYPRLATTQVFADTNQFITVIDPAMIVRWLSASAKAFQVDVVGRSIVEVIHPDDFGQAAQAFDGQAQLDGFLPSLMAHVPVPIRITTATGFMPFDATGRWVQDEQGNDWLVAVLRDSTARYATERAIQKLVAGTDEVAIMQCLIAACNEFGGVAGAQMFWNESGHATRTFGDLGNDPLCSAAQQWGDLSSVESPGRALVSYDGDWCYALPVIAGCERVGVLVLWGTGTVPDISLVSAVMGPLLNVAALSLQRSREVADLEMRATTDQGTGLLNRHAFFSRLDNVVQHAAVMYIDLDAFKVINDRFGHTLGDRFLNVIGRRLSDATQGEDLVARVGGDEFAVLCRSVTASEARSLADRVLAALNQTFVIDGHRLEAGASIGIAYTDEPVVGRDLLDSADRALLEAKAQGKGRAVLVSSLV